MLKLKKHLFLLAAASLLILTSACKGSTDGESSVPSGEVSVSVRNEYNLGAAVVHGVSNKKVAYAATFAAVITDESGKIIKCVIDQLEAEADTDGVTQQIGKEFPTKNALGDRYSMKGASGIGKEWYEQAEAFASYCVGKTISQVEKGLDENGKMPDLSASCTVNATDFVSAVKAAVKNTGKVFFTKSVNEVKLGLSVKTTLSSASEESENGENGVAVFSCTFSAAAVDGSNKVCSTYIDETECEIPFDKDGNVYAEGIKSPFSKQEKGNDYGMKAASKINKEWFEQANAFASYCEGKTAEQIEKSANEEGKVPDLAASCTVYSANFAVSVAEAVKNAK